MTAPFLLSIEPTGGKSFLHGFHLGTDERLARMLAEERFHNRNAAGEHTCTVALIRDRRIVAVYDGAWQDAA
jgi:hypothetical protein